MNRQYYYSSAPEQHPHHHSQRTQWTYAPSFYNGYSTQIPVIVHQPIQVVQTYYPPIEQHHHQQQDEQYREIPSSSSSTYPSSSSMKSSNIFRHAFSRSNQANNNSDEEFLIHERQLNRNLAQHDIVRLPVKGDGNCLFYALAEGLMYEMKIDVEFHSHLRQLFRLSADLRLAEFADRLRQICVDQWRINEDYYSQFVVKEKVAFLKEVKKFSKNGVSDSTLGDIVPLTIANSLNIHITIFTSVSDLPRIDVKPEYRSQLLPYTRKTIYLAYNQSGLGHYDAAYPRV